MEVFFLSGSLLLSLSLLSFRMVDLKITDGNSGGSQESGETSSVTCEVVIVQNVTDNSSFSVKLDGNNYQLWQRLMKIHIQGIGKWSYVTGSIARPAAGPKVDEWDTANNNVMGILLKAMTPEVMRLFAHYDSPKAIWDSVAAAYYDGSDFARVHELNVKAFKITHNGQPVATFYANLKTIWQELDQRNPNPMTCEADINSHRSEQDKMRVHIFLAGLDSHFEGAKNELLRLATPPTLEQAFAYIRRDEGNKAAAQNLHTEISGLAIHATSLSQNQYQPRTQGSQQNQNYNQLTCNYCKEVGHFKNQCPKLRRFTYNNNSSWRGGNNNNTGGRGGRGGGQRGKAAIQLVPEPDFYSIEGQDPSKGNVSLTKETRGKIGVALHVSDFTGSDTWIIDSGASDHMTYDKSFFLSMSSPSISHVSNVNGASFPVLGVGSVQVTPSIVLHNVLYVPSLSHHLLSVSQLGSHNKCSVTFYPMYVIFQNLCTKVIMGKGDLRERLFHLDCMYAEPKQASEPPLALTLNSDRLNELWLWHRRLGHPSFGVMKKSMPSLFLGFSESRLHCETCALAKSHRTSYPSSFHSSTMPFELIHSDVWGPSKHSTLSGMRYFVLFIDDFTRLSWVVLLKSKDSVFSAFTAFHNLVCTQYDAHVKIFRSDNGGEFVNHSFHDYFQHHGIIHQTSCPQTPEQNGVSERKNRHLLDMARSLLLSANMPKYLWGETVLCASHLINRLPSAHLQGRVPLEVLSHYVSIPSSNTLPARVFGCVAYVHLYKNQRSKLDARALKCVFVGYGSHQKGYKCYHPQSQKFYVTMDVTFNEDACYFLPPVTHRQGEKSCYYEDLFNGTDERLEFSSLEDLGTERDKEDSREELSSTRDKEISCPLVGPTFTKRIPQLDRTPNHHGTQLDPELHSPTHIGSDLDLATWDSNDGSPNGGNWDLGSALRRRGTGPGIGSPGFGLREPRLDPETGQLAGEEEAPDSAVVPLGSPVPDSVQSAGDAVIPDSSSLDSVADFGHGGFNSVADFSSPSSSKVNSPSSSSQVSSAPTSPKDAMRDEKWMQAMAVEMDALEKNCTWELVSLPPGKKTVGCRWVYTVKHNSNGSVDRYKARLVAKGYTQKYGVDYDETFAPVAKINTIRVLLSLAANLDWPLQQFDVKNAFLHGDLHEEVYMDLPPGYGTSSKEQVVCKLQKSLYGLKQSPRAWFGWFTKFMKKIGYRQSNSDHTLFLKHQGGKVTALIIYVDDMVVTCDDLEEIQRLQGQLSSEFEMKDLGSLKYFLGIEVARGKDCIVLSQRKYVLDLLAETGMLDCQPVDTPIEQNHRLAEYLDQVPTSKARYQRLVGRLIYLSHTRPDLAYAVSVVSQFMHNPSEAHMGAVFCILGYLKSAPGKGLIFSKYSHLDVSGYTDADWAGNITDRRSTSGYFTFVGGNLVTWKSKKQKVVARSSAEAECRGMARGLCEMLWLRNLLRDLGFKQKKAMPLYCDNKAAIEIAHNPVQHDRTKHMEVDRHFIKENLDRKVILFPFVPTEE
ncbi:putative RNA-directed DNA polymerase [Rosa chinensis]|uniref:Putative RNA-directed DNA polymerase n=1 Tax=Rosa chinensis TaxID=74649 RepID=A0A2P6SD57_ROSCH|nr:putative RNA-directed DNA polymerase [Rosa chinensis]